MKVFATKLSLAAVLALSVLLAVGAWNVRDQATAAPQDCLALATQLKQAVQATGRVDMAAFEEVKACIAANASATGTAAPAGVSGSATQTPPSIAAIPVGYYALAIFLAGPIACLSFQSDGTILGMDRDSGTPPAIVYTGSYIGIPYLFAVFNATQGPARWDGFILGPLGFAVKTDDQPFSLFHTAWVLADLPCT